MGLHKNWCYDNVADTSREQAKGNYETIADVLY